jgi:rSAM/selenodomain-associated transferase 1
MSAALAIFVKTPGFSPIKTRLAHALGEAAAIEFHRRACAAVAAVVDAAIRAGLPIAGYWAVAERAALESEEWRGLPQLWQGEGDLGARLHAVYTALQARHGTALLIGADAPQLSVVLLREALAALDNPATPFVLGPAADGGFWLFGARVPVPAPVWLSIRYSQAHTAAELGAALTMLGGIASLPMLADVDTEADLATLREALMALPQPLPQQCSLIEWLEKLGFSEQPDTQPASRNGCASSASRR